MTDKSKNILIVGFLLVFSFFLRWEYVEHTEIIQPIRADARAYTLIAHNLAHDHLFTSKADHKGMPSHEARPAGYPFFLAAIVSLTSSFQSFYLTTLLVQCFFGTITVGLVYGLARFLLPPLWSFVAALLVSVAPHMISMSAYILSESLFTLLLTLAMLLIGLASRRESLGGYVLAGIILGLAIFVRPVLAIFPLLCVPVIGFMRRKESLGRLVTIITLFLVAAFSLQTSWSLWRRVTLGADAAQARQLKVAFVCGIYPDITYKNLPGMPYREDPEFEKIMTMGYPEILGRIAENIIENPGTHLTWWLVGKPTMFWSWKVFFNDGINVYPVKSSWFDLNAATNLLRTIMLAIHPFLVFLAFGGVVFHFRRWFREPPNPIYFLSFLLVGHFTLMFMVLAPFPRYALPLGPALYVMAIHGLQQSFVFVKKRWSGTLS